MNPGIYPNMAAFITGSRAYGLPRADSDYDIGVVMPRALIELLESISEAGTTLRFGRLNLVPFASDEPEELVRLEAWHRVNDHLIQRKPVSKEDAVQSFRDAGAEDPRRVISTLPRDER